MTGDGRESSFCETEMNNRGAHFTVAGKRRHATSLYPLSCKYLSEMRDCLGANVTDGGDTSFSCNLPKKEDV